jgi:hypothetical protein
MRTITSTAIAVFFPELPLLVLLLAGLWFANALIQ